MSFVRGREATRIDFLNAEPPDWPRLGGAQRMRVIPEELHRQRAEAAESAPRVRVIEADEHFFQWARLEFVGGQALHLEREGEARQRLDRMRLISQLLSERSVWADLPGGDSPSSTWPRFWR